jgi:hypothetical protein
MLRALALLAGRAPAATHRIVRRLVVRTLIAWFVMTASFAATMPALATSATPAKSGKSAATAPPAAIADAATNELGLPRWTPPDVGHMAMRVVREGDTMKVVQYFLNGRKRTDVQAQGMTMSMIQLDDADQTTYSVMPSEKMVMKTTRTSMERMTRGHMPDPAANAAPEGASDAASPDAPKVVARVRRVGEDKVDGRAAIQYEVEMDGEKAWSWNDPVTGAPLRMKSAEATIDFTDVSSEKPRDDAFAVPKDYQVMDMSKMPTGMGAGVMSGLVPGGMSGMAGMAGMGAGIAAGGKGGAPGAMMGGVPGMPGGMPGGGSAGGMMRNALEQAGTHAAANAGGQLGAAAGASLGGPLGAMAGQYIGSKVAGWLAGKVMDRALPGGPASGGATTPAAPARTGKP